MNWFDFLIFYPVGLLYPSFRLYVSLARRKSIDNFLKYFVVFAFVFSIIETINLILGSFWIYTLSKVAVLWLLIVSDFNGAVILLDNLIRTFMISMPFLVQFGYKSHFSSNSQLGKDVSSYIHMNFIERYHKILDEIDN